MIENVNGRRKTASLRRVALTSLLVASGIGVVGVVPALAANNNSPAPAAFQSDDDRDRGRGHDRVFRDRGDVRYVWYRVCDGTAIGATTTTTTAPETTTETVAQEALAAAVDGAAADTTHDHGDDDHRDHDDVRRLGRRGLPDLRRRPAAQGRGEGGPQAGRAAVLRHDHRRAEGGRIHDGIHDHDGRHHRRDDHRRHDDHDHRSGGHRLTPRAGSRERSISRVGRRLVLRSAEWATRERHAVAARSDRTTTVRLSRRNAPGCRCP